MATVIVINPMGADVTWMLPFLLKGTVAETGDTVYTLPYTNQAGAANIANGVALLNAKIMGTSGTIKVFAYSEGAQVATKWLRDYGTTTPVEAYRLSFLFIGNAERKYGGVLYHRSQFNSIADTAGLPSTVPYQVVDFARQYDGFADFPTATVFGTAANQVGTALTDWSKFGQVFQSVWNLFTTDATKNAAQNTLKGFSDVHSYYFSVAPDDDENVTLTEGSVTYVWAPTFPLPMLGAFATAPVDSTLRTQIETQYSRPVSLLPPNYDNVPPLDDYLGDAPSPPVDVTGPGLTTVQARFFDAAGEPSIGYVEFRPRALRNTNLAASAGGGLVSPERVRVPLDDGELEATLEPGDYSIAIVLQNSRTIYTVANIPAGAGVMNLRELLGAYIPVPNESDSVFSVAGYFEWTIPTASQFIDVVLLGGGGGGDDGAILGGAGGTCGAWHAVTLERGEDIPFSTQALSGVVGAGGIHRTNGKASTLSGAGMSPLSAAGGLWGANTIEVLGVLTGTTYGQGVDKIQLTGRDYEGGGVQTKYGADGNGPGGGASGGFSFQKGGRGADGRVWLRAY